MAWFFITQNKNCAQKISIVMVVGFELRFSTQKQHVSGWVVDLPLPVFFNP